MTCGKSHECTDNKNVCVYKYACGEGNCNCETKSSCCDDTLCEKNHQTFLDNVKRSNDDCMNCYFDCMSCFANNKCKTVELSEIKK